MTPSDAGLPRSPGSDRQFATGPRGAGVDKRTATSGVDTVEDGGVNPGHITNDHGSGDNQSSSDEVHSGDLRHLIEAQAQALGPVLYAAMATSLAAATPRLSASPHAKALKHSRYPHLLPLLVRAEMREFLEDNPVPNDWKVRGNSKLMAQLNLVHDDLNLRMSFLKERRRTYPGGVPTAGPNEQRQQRWTNPPLDIALTDPAIKRASPHKPVDLLLLWDFTSTSKLDEFRLRIAHTRRPGVYGSAVPCDLLLEVQAGGSIHTQLRFTGSAEEEDLFNLDIVKNENHGS